MSFAKSKKVLHEQSKFLPPPGYYDSTLPSNQPHSYNFNKGQRFPNKIHNYNPGPGSYFNNDKQSIKKKLLEEANQKEPLKILNSNNKQQTDIKISSIPSIPKKSATRVYQELAPGILILHEEEYQNSNVGPGSYDVNDTAIRRKAKGIKIQPEHKKRFHVIEQEPQVKVPTIAQQLREQKRLMYKQNIIKSSNVNKNDINSTDLCLETIILREKLLRADQIPPPGFYYNEEAYSTFKKNQYQIPPELQALGGKQQRFKSIEKQPLGPGAYSVKEDNNKKGGFISKNPRIDIETMKKMFNPGPGAYQVPSFKISNQEPKGNYPPIFGSGCKRFMSAPKTSTSTPGPGSYKVDKKKNKKAKYIKIRKDFYESQPMAKQDQDMEKPLRLNQTGQTDDTFYSTESKGRKPKKDNYYFKSKVERFLNQKNEMINGPGAYEVNSSGFDVKTYNKTTDGYIGDKSQRFDDVKIRPNLGPGAYN